MNRVDIAISGIEEPLWLKKCRAFILKILKSRCIENWELSILLCDDSCIKELNAKYLKKNHPTDVLTFSQGESFTDIPDFIEGPIPAGDIIISMENLKQNTEITSIEEELKRLLIHGILHLQGMDHNDKKSEMTKIQEETLVKYKRERIF